MPGTINIFQARSGDCIGISFTEDNKNYNIVIDAGWDTYDSYNEYTLQGFAQRILDQGDKIDLFIITHIDNDHIRGIEAFIQDFGEKDLVKEYWFNWCPYGFSVNPQIGESNIGVKEGIYLREYLRDKGLYGQDVIARFVKNIGGAKLTVLSPSREKQDLMHETWVVKEIEKELREIRKQEKEGRISRESTDYGYTVETLVEKKFDKDTSPANGSSIAVLFETKSISVLFLADSHPSVVVDSLKTLLEERKEEKLRVDYVKVSHHGSRRNTNKEILELIDCSKFIISTNGDGGKPTKEALARIVHHHHSVNKDLPIQLIFNYEDKKFENIFTKPEKNKYNIVCRSPKDNDRNDVVDGYTINW